MSYSKMTHLDSMTTLEVVASRGCKFPGEIQTYIIHRVEDRDYKVYIPVNKLRAFGVLCQAMADEIETYRHVRDRLPFEEAAVKGRCW